MTRGGYAIGMLIICHLVGEERALLVGNFDMPLRHHQTFFGVIGDLVRLQQNLARLRLRAGWGAAPLVTTAIAASAMP